jgi:hypothetical protein
MHPIPCSGLAGYVSTFQAVAATPNLRLAGVRRHRYPLVPNEAYRVHLPAELDPQAPDDEANWSHAALPLLEITRLSLLLSGTLERASSGATL